MQVTKTFLKLAEEAEQDPGVWLPEPRGWNEVELYPIWKQGLGAAKTLNSPGRVQAGQ